MKISKNIETHSSLDLDKARHCILIQHLSRFLQRPAKVHLDLAFQVLGYLKNRPLTGLLYSRAGNSIVFDLLDNHSLILYGYADASWNDNPDDCRSSTGFVLLVGSTAIAWCSRRQEFVS